MNLRHAVIHTIQWMKIDERDRTYSLVSYACVVSERSSAVRRHLRVEEVAVVTKHDSVHILMVPEHRLLCNSSTQDNSM